MKKQIALLLFTLAFIPVLTGSAFAQSVIGLEEEIPYAMTAYIPNAGFEFLTTTIEDTINALPINLLLLAMNPLMAEECYIVASMGIYLTQAHVGDIDITVSTSPLLGLESRPNTLYVMFEIYKAQGAGNLFELTVSGDLICIAPSYSASAEIDVTKIQVAAAVGIQKLPTGELNLLIPEIKANLVDFSFDIHNFPDEIEDLFNDMIEDAIISFAEDFGLSLIEDYIEEELGAILLEGDTAFGNYTLHYGINPSIITDTTGAYFHSNMELYLVGTDINPCIDPGWPIGSRYTDNPVGNFGPTTPNGDPYHLVMALSDDILNQLIYSAFAKGLLCLNPTSILDKDFKGRDFENLMDADLKGALDKMLDVDWLFAIYPNSSPLIEVGYGGDDLVLVIDDMRFDWSVMQEGRYVELVNASFSVEFGLDVEMDENNNIVITFNNPSVVLDIHSSSFNLLPIEQMEPFLNTLITTFLGLIGDLIPPIPIPSFGGWSLLIQEVDPTGPAEDFLAIYLLVESPAMDPMAQRPDTRFVFTAGDRQLRGDAFDFGPAESARFGLNDGRELSVSLEAAGGEVNKYLYRVDGTAWKMLYGNRLTLTGQYEGMHTLEVKAKNDLNRMDDSPAMLRFVCDNVAPTIVSFERVGDRVTAAAEDYQDSALRYRFRVDGAPWSEAAVEPSWPLDSISAGDHRIEVIALDRAGNESRPASLDVSGEDDGDDDDSSGSDPSEDNDDTTGDDSDPRTRSDDESSSGGCGF